MNNASDKVDLALLDQLHVEQNHRNEAGTSAHDGDREPNPAIELTVEVVPGDGGGVTIASDQAETDDQALLRLAALTPVEYDRVRKDEARQLGVKLSTLDDLVTKARADEFADAGSDPFPKVTPWAAPVDGDVLLDDITRTVRRFVVCDSEVAQSAALWIMAAWFVDQISACPIALINAPEKACGKTQLLTIIGRLVPRPAQLSNISSSVLFRMIEKYQPTLLVDEIETVLTQEAVDLRGLFNAGHTRDSAYVWRSVPVGDDFEPKRFAVFGMKAIAGINADRLAETVTSRSIVMPLRRKLPHEKVERLRYAEHGLFNELCAKAARWAEDNAEAVRCARPTLPDALSDRAQDNWEPLFSIAEVAKGEWPVLARAAALKLSGNPELSQSAGAELLADIKAIFDAKCVRRLSITDLLRALLSDEEKPWATWNHGKPLSPRQLGKKLSEYGVRSKAIRIGYEVQKGYERDQFADAFSRYLSDAPSAAVTGLQTAADADLGVTQGDCVTVTQKEPVTQEANADAGCNRVTGQAGEGRQEKDL
ncbi:DUF3631 domain-containing protein [Burkholderia sp. Ac-20365]|uniref:DUF3631 domain-containing protein n=1 Tax=Burkholderia sp. Ac-20365 TaxID=2703897 RepID=UPI0032163EF4